MKKFLLGALVTLVVFAAMAAAVLYIFRNELFQYSAETILKKNLPDYITVESLAFDPEKGTLRVNGLSVKNPDGYEDRYLARIDVLACAYKMRGKNITDGIEITDITADRATINIERRRDGRLNINDMGSVLASGKQTQPEAQAPQTKPAAQGFGIPNPLKGKDISDFLTLTDTINIKDGKVILKDKRLAGGNYQLSFDTVNGTIRIPLSENMRQVREVATQGSGIINGDQSQRVGWVISMDTLKTALTMSNRIELSGVSLSLIKPYYDPFSPIDIRSGTVSGTLVCDFDSGNIGAMSTLKFRNLRFAMKEDQSSAGLWNAAIPDLVKYLQSAPNEIMFDFKIKGSISKPQFYPGPIVRQAIQSMTVDKISQAIQEATKDNSQESGAAAGSQAEKSDTEKAVDAIRALFKK